MAVAEYKKACDAGTNQNYFEGVEPEAKSFSAYQSLSCHSSLVVPK